MIVVSCFCMLFTLSLEEWLCIPESMPFWRSRCRWIRCDPSTTGQGPVGSPAESLQRAQAPSIYIRHYTIYYILYNILLQLDILYNILCLTIEGVYWYTAIDFSHKTSHVAQVCEQAFRGAAGLLPSQRPTACWRSRRRPEACRRAPW